MLIIELNCDISDIPDNPMNHYGLLDHINQALILPYCSPGLHLLILISTMHTLTYIQSILTIN